MNRQVAKKYAKLVTMFVDLRAAFYSVDRRVLLRALEKTEVRNGLRETVEKVYRETISRVKVREKMEEAFWIEKRGETMVLSEPDTLNILTAD